MLLRRVMLLLGSGALWATVACGGPEGEVVNDTDEATGQLRAQTSGLTLWMDPRPELRDAETGALGWRIRVSKNLGAVRASTQDAAVGQTSLLSARRFDLTLPDAAAIHAVLSGAPVYLGIEASEGRERSYEARFNLLGRLTGFSGDRRLFVLPQLTARWAGGAAPLSYGLRISVPRGTAAGSVRLEHPAVGVVSGRSSDGRSYSFDLTPAQVIALYARPAGLSFSASLSGSRMMKRANLELVVDGLALTTAAAPFPRASCDPAVSACLAGAGDDGDCGDYQAVLRCQPAGPTCEPNLESEIANCIALQNESAEADPDRGPLMPLEALQYCTEEGDLTGPMFDALCGFNNALPYCACQGEETCFERFDRDYLRPCGEVLRPRYDCVFGSTYRELRSSRPNLVSNPRRVLVLADVTDSLTAQQVILAVQQSSHNDVTTLEEAFDRVDQGEVNQLDLWEGSNGQAYSAFEYGAGDNSYGAVFTFGTTTLVTRIQDGDLYDGSTPAQLGCRIPQGPAWGACQDHNNCAPGLRCWGVVNSYDDSTGELLGNVAPGKCVAPVIDTPRLDTACSAADPCPLGEGLRCSTIGTGNPGWCRPVWMFGRFNFPSVMPLPRRGLSEFPIMVSGLATVPEEAVFEGILNSRDFTRVRLSLANPTYRTTQVFFDGPALGRSGVEALLGQSSGEVQVRLPVGVPGDEGVNGEWLLRIETVRNPTGSDLEQLYGEPTLSLSSRWD